MAVEAVNNAGAAHTISVLVADKPGVLVRVATVFARRGFNIDSLAVSPAHQKGLSRMTVVTHGKEEGVTQIVKQLDKLIDVVHVYDYAEMDVVSREMAIVKVRTPSDKRSAVMEVANIFRAKSVDIGKGSVVFEITGSSSKLDAFESMMDEFGIIEMMRTGKLILRRGETPT